MPRPRVNHAGVTIIIHESKEIMLHTSCFSFTRNYLYMYNMFFFLFCFVFIFFVLHDVGECVEHKISNKTIQSDGSNHNIT